MTRFALVSLTFASLLCAGSTVGAQQVPPRNEPGYPTLARVLVINRADLEAIPVTVQPSGMPLSVAVSGMPTVSLTETATVGARRVRQTWEYRQITITPGADPTNLLNAAGADGWEATGLGMASGDRTLLILKRPK